MPLWGEMPNPAETTVYRCTLGRAEPGGEPEAPPKRAVVIVSLRVGCVPGRDAMPRCAGAPLCGIPACLRAAVGFLRAGRPALGGVRGLGWPAALGGHARRGARGRAAAAHLGAARRRCRAGA